MICSFHSSIVCVCGGKQHWCYDHFRLWPAHRPPLFLHTVALKTQFIRSYKEVFRSAQAPPVTELYYLYGSLGSLELLTTSSAGSRCVVTAGAEKKQGLFWINECEDRCLFELSRKKQEATQRRGHHSDFIPFFYLHNFSLFTVSLHFYTWHKEENITSYTNRITCLPIVSFALLWVDKWHFYTTWQNMQSSAKRTHECFLEMLGLFDAAVCVCVCVEGRVGYHKVTKVTPSGSHTDPGEVKDRQEESLLFPTWNSNNKALRIKSHITFKLQD